MSRRRYGYQYDYSERYGVKKERVSRHIELGKERDAFSCPRGDMYFHEEPSVTFGVQKEEYRIARKFKKYNRRYQELYGEEI